MSTKLGQTLAEELERAKPADELDVVFELSATETSDAEPAKSRGERIALMQDAFNRNSIGLERAVQEAGGKIIDKAWINQTVRARVPAQALENLGRLESVLLIDAPRELTPESSQ
jgi:hypothetical protein